MINDVQKANLWKRISAFMFDAILVITVAVGIAYLLSTALKYDNNLEKYEEMRKSYETQYGISFDVTADALEEVSEEERTAYKEAYEKAALAFTTDEEVANTQVLIVNLTLIITVFSALIPMIIFEFVIPLCFGHGRTLGKKIFSTGVIRVDGVKISVFQLFVRSILGKFTLETMIPIFLILLFLFEIMPLACLVGLMVLGLLQVALLLFTQLRTPIHDMIAGTTVVDYASQMIFESPEELLEYKEKIHAEAAEKAEYR